MNATQTTSDPTAALRAALIVETRIAEALAQRNREVLDTVDSLVRRALADASDVPEARRRLEAVTRSLREGLAAGETGETGDLRRLAESTLVGFDFGPESRIAINGPAVVLSPEARRLVALALFDIASRSDRFGALSDPMGRASLDWRTLPDGDLRLTWREFGVVSDLRRMRGAGGQLLDLLSQRFGGPMRLRTIPGGLMAELTLPAEDILLLATPPRRALVAVSEAATALTIAALLHARGVGEVAIARRPLETVGALAAGGIDLLVTDDPAVICDAPGLPPPTIFVQPPDAPAPAADSPVIRLPASATRLAAAMAAALGGAARPSR